MPFHCKYKMFSFSGEFNTLGPQFRRGLSADHLLTISFGFVGFFLAVSSLLLFHVGLHFLFIIEMNGNNYLFNRTRSDAQLSQIFEVF